jgi:hexosaminidase
MHGGLVVDTSQHYLTIALLHKAINSMAYAKLNVLHWHIVDDQSFPLEVQSYPNLQGESAVKLVEYARLRGTRVLLEIDTPSHTRSWYKWYPGECPPKPYNDQSCTSLDPSTNTTFEMINNILEELAPLFPENLLHVGQDDVNVSRWEAHENPTIAEWQQQHGFDIPD